VPSLEQSSAPSVRLVSMTLLQFLTLGCTYQGPLCTLFSVCCIFVLKHLHFMCIFLACAGRVVFLTMRILVLRLCI
jgi:hypothetical protein